MDLYYEPLEDLRKNQSCQRRSCSGDEWKRWDDELLEDFSRWLNRAAKAFLIALGVVSAAVVIRVMI